jgi:hypothetical protein
MPTLARFLGYCAASMVFISVALAQTNPPPSDPLEMVTREPQTLTKPADRSAALDLLDRARKNFNLHDISTPYSLHVSFETNGSTQFEGQGTMEELSDGAGHWSWSAKIQDFTVVRIGNENHVYGNNPSEPVPLRVQLIRAALHWPIMRNSGAAAIRSATAMLDGRELNCFLLSASIPPNPAPRAWVENEYCIDPASGLLQTWSEAPGIYAVYDYTGAVEYHRHVLPREISIYEDGRRTVQVHVENLEDARDIDPSVFKPTPDMVDAGGSFTLSTPYRFPMRVDPSDAPTSTFFQPVIVHAILDAQEGRVLDAEALQNSDRELSRAAIDLVRSTSFPASGFQQEVFINVQFHMPAISVGGPPVFHSRVAWVIYNHPARNPPPKKTPHTGI